MTDLAPCVLCSALPPKSPPATHLSVNEITARGSTLQGPAPADCPQSKAALAGRILPTRAAGTMAPTGGLGEWRPQPGWGVGDGRGRHARALAGPRSRNADLPHLDQSELPKFRVLAYLRRCLHASTFDAMREPGCPERSMLALITGWTWAYRAWVSRRRVLRIGRGGGIGDAGSRIRAALRVAVEGLAIGPHYSLH